MLGPWLVLALATGERPAITVEIDVAENES